MLKIFYFQGSQCSPMLRPSLLLPCPPFIHNNRYFTPMEVARLMHFPPSFAFPARTYPSLPSSLPSSHPFRPFTHPPSLPPFLLDVSDKKCYELLGNSLHVGVATELLVWLLREEGREGGEGGREKMKADTPKL